MKCNLLFRTPSDWERLWHQEKHARCKESIIKHMKWACDKDIYRITRRSGISNLDGKFKLFLNKFTKKAIHLHLIVPC